jgi:hypothetical protein
VFCEEDKPPANIRMEIVNPSRLPSLGPQSITIHVHLDETRIITIDPTQFSKIYPFETLFSLKQRIANTMEHTPPNQLYIATEVAPNQFQPLEFVWPFQTPTHTLPNPQDPTVAEIPDPRIYEHGAKKPVFPTIYSAVTMERTVFYHHPPPYVVHVWTLASIVPRALQQDAIPEAVFEGFVHLYFPYLKTMPPINKPDKEATHTLKEYRIMVDKRLAKLEAGVRSPAVQQAKLPILKELYIFKCRLPAVELTPGMLDILFYETQPTPHRPFLRFFPARDKTPALIKVATNEDGVMVIRSERLLDILMSEKPNTATGAVLLMKVPIDNPRAPLGTCWTLRIYEDGTAELYIGAPRRDAPLPTDVINQAMRMVQQVLQDTPWAMQRTGISLCELTAIYELHSGLDTGKPGKTELHNRLDPFLPLFSMDPPQDTAALSLRYKGVSNFVQTSNPLMNYLTALYLNKSAKTTADVPKGYYVDALRKEFGISLQEAKAAEDEWIERHSKYVTTYKVDAEGELRIKELSIREAKCGTDNYQAYEDTTIAAYNTGASLSIYNQHPAYRMLIAGADSVLDLRRMLTLMTLFVNQTAAELKISNTPVNTAAEIIDEPELAAPPPVIPEELEAGWEQLFSGMMMDATAEPELTEPERPDVPETTDGPAVAALAAAEALKEAVAMPTALAPDEQLPPISKEWYLNNLKSKNKDLFQYAKTTDARVKLYSRQCQLAQHRQPNVLSPEAYKRAKLLYGDTVIWLEAPPSKDIQQALTLASKTAGQRKGLPKHTIVDLEILALSKGFPLKGNQSVSDGDKTVSAEKKEIIQRLMLEQQNKPLWIVVRTGTDAEHINYYLCAEYWCVRDDLPLIGKVFQGTMAHDGRPKEPNSCPFCHGFLIQDKDKPAIGETVIEREKTATSDKVAHYAGFLAGLFHPDSFAMPCCFTDPKSLEPPEGSKLPSTASADEEAAVPDEPNPVLAPAPALSDLDNRNRPFSPTSKTSTAQNRWYIPNQNILGRKSQDWFMMEKGAMAVPPSSVNRFLGQTPETFLTKNKGVGAEKINSYLTAPATAFLRYGLGHSAREPGRSIVSLIAWAKYATEELIAHDDDAHIPSDDSILEIFNNGLFEIRMARAFEQANYGTLVHEFAANGHGQRPGTTGQYQEWCTRMGGLTPANAGVKEFYSAWTHFKAYVNDLTEPKDLRLWSMLFAVPNLFTTTGCILVRIRVPKNKTETPTIQCPPFGISFHDQDTPPPFIFLLEDEVTGQYDPVVFYEGTKGPKPEKYLFGAIQPDAAEMRRLSPTVQAALRAFSDNYLSATVGCGRSVAPVHPWLPLRDAKFVPRLSELALSKVFDISDPALRLVRDRSNRLVGILVPHRSATVYIPCVDDGLILPDVASKYGHEALQPPPDIKEVFEVYIQNEAECTPEAVLHPGLMPVALRKRGSQYVAIDLRCGATIPVKPFPINTSKKKPVKGACYQALLARPAGPLEDGDEPWSADLALIGPTAHSDRLDAATHEEELEDAYQFLRISFSNWLMTPEGQPIAQAVDQLRQARNRLPLFELQARMDSLLYPIVRTWIHASDTSAPQRPSILRRDCLQIKTEAQCAQGCVWQGSDSLRPCLIHTTGTERYTDPVRLMCARLTDELLRTFGKAMELLHQGVSRLKSLPTNQLVYEPMSLLFSASGRGSRTLYETLGYTERQPTAYTTGLTYPEEVGIDAETTALPADWTDALRRLPGNVMIRDPSIVLNQIVQSLTESHEIQFKGTNTEWQALAAKLNVDVLKTQYNSERHTIDVYEVIPGATSTNTLHTYIVLDVDGLPLQNVRTRQFTIQEAELPASIRAWIS